MRMELLRDFHMEALMNEENERRELRRKRKIRNMIISYTVLVLFLLILIVGAVIGITRVRKIQQAKQAALIEKSAAAEALKLLQDQAAQKAAAQFEEEQKTEEQVKNEDAPNKNEVIALEIQSLVMSMTLEEKVAGLFVITPEDLTGVGKVVQAGSSTKEALTQYPVGGIIYSSKNVQSKDQLVEMIGNTKEFSKYPLFVGIGEEGGENSQLTGKIENLPKVENMSDIGAGGDKSKAMEAGAMIGGYLAPLGFNMNLAPVADVLTDSGNTYIGKRSFGGDALVVSQMVASEVEGMQAAGVSAALLHFPGLGGGEGDPQMGSSLVKKTLEEIKAENLLPFQAGIEAGADFVVVANAMVPSLTEEEVPASLSSEVIKNLLRGELGFSGIVVTAPLNQKAITSEYSSSEAALMAIHAGADMIMMPGDFKEAYTGVLEAVNSGRITQERLNESLLRIFQLKYKDGVG